MQTACGVRNDHIIAACGGRLDRIKDDGGGVCAFACADDGHTGTACPDLQLLAGSGAEGVTGGQHDPLALPGVIIGQLGNAGGLAHAVHADDQHDARLGRQVKRGVAHVQLFNQNIAQRLLHIVAALDALLVHDIAQLFHRVVRDRCAEVSHNEAVLKLVIEFVVNGLPHDGVEPRLFDLCKNTHLFLLALYSLMLSSFAMSFILIVSTLLTPRSCIVTP